MTIILLHHERRANKLRPFKVRVEVPPLSAFAAEWCGLVWTSKGEDGRRWRLQQIGSPLARRPASPFYGNPILSAIPLPTIGGNRIPRLPPSGNIIHPSRPASQRDALLVTSDKASRGRSLRWETARGIGVSETRY